jgi:hypothetical protein
LGDEREDPILQKKNSPNIAFHFFTTIKLISTLIYQSLNNYVFSVFCQQSYYRNIGYFEEIYTCENLTFHLQTDKDVKFVSEMVCLHLVFIDV